MKEIKKNEGLEPNEELQSRREFFKRAAKSALPILAFSVFGPSVLYGCGDDEEDEITPNEANSNSSKSDGCTSCNKTCMQKCSTSCGGTCRGGCANKCTGYTISKTSSLSCKNNCKITCKSGCDNTCKSSCYSSCKKEGK